MKVLHISYSYDFSDGGITTVVKQIIQEQKKNNLSVEWLASNLFHHPFKSRQLFKKILEINPSIIHLHGLWRVHTRIANKLIKAGIPYVITPHGMLDKWALNQSRIKKFIAWNVWEKKALYKSAFVQVLSDAEFQTIQKLNSNLKCHQISNGIFIPSQKELSEQYKPQCWENKIPNNSKVLLFMGRFHKKKGIKELIKAWELVKDNPLSKDWWICFVGNGDMKLFKNIFSSNNKRILISKAAFDIEKDKLLRNSSAFILCSHSEGLPMAVLEAMSYGLPCLISENCNLPEALRRGAAIKTNPLLKDIVKSLNLLIMMNDNEREKISYLAKEYVIENHNWETIISEMEKLYRSICKDIQS